jgi:tetratricopeptide (TPR) repeat protein
MRLLHFDDFGSLVLTDFTGRTIPPYAILSHRWGDDEVVFEDLAHSSYKDKTGHRKIEFCAKQAAQDQLQHFWIDTCCIDRWNIYELTNAVNSMFRWYQNAAKCYVFLADVSASTAKDAQQQSTWEARFRGSEWFTRGWTLQELIAPASVEFFSSEGRRLGDKDSLRLLLHEITSIPIEALQACSLPDFSISDRMAWAENRKTTQPEDGAYCLLGIFNIDMPLSYGEGKTKALSRLQEELKSTSATPSIIPFSRNERFVGRQSQLAEVEAKLFTSKQTTKIAITGEGGTGKSQLALELAHRARRKNKSCSVFWIDASNVDSLYQAYSSIAQKLKIPGWEDEKADVIQMVKLHLSVKSERYWLLIFDNADDVDLGSAGPSTAGAINLNDYLPQSELGSIIFTTTNRDTAKILATQTIMLQGMLENHLINPILVSEREEMKLLVKELSYLPLAIVQAAAYTNIGNITLKDYRSQLVKQKEEEGFKLRSALSEGKPKDYDTTSPVNTTLLISLDQIRQNHSLAADYLFLTACLDRKDIPLDLLEAASTHEREDAVGILNAYALITRRPAESALDLHRLVHLTVRQWLEKQECLSQWTGKAMKCLLEVFPDHNHGSRSKWRRLLPHAKYALSYGPIDQNDETRTNLVWKCVMTLHTDGRDNEAEELFVQVMETRKKKLGAYHPDTLPSMANLASTYRNQGRWDAAEELEVQVMETSKKKLGADHPSTLTSMNNLASTFWNQGRWDAAEELFVQVIETSKKKLGADHPSTVTSMANLASTYQNQGRWDAAEELEVQVMATRKKKLGADHPSTLTSMNNLAWTWKAQNRDAEALELISSCLELLTRKLGADHPETLACTQTYITWKLE